MTDFILNLIQSWGYVGIFILMFLENVFPPIPSEVIMGLGGIAVAKGHFDFWTLVAVAVAGTTAGNWIWYGIGRWIGYERLKPFIDRHGRWLTLSPGDIDAAHQWFVRHGAMAVFFGRMIPAIRTLISVPAGLARMPMWRFLTYTVAGSALWTGVLTFAGLALHENYARVADYVDPVSKLVVVTVVVIYLYRVITWKPH